MSALAMMRKKCRSLREFDSYRHDQICINNHKNMYHINCCKKNEGKPNEANYHNLMAGCIAHPNQKTVIPFAPEAIVKHDGKTKNDGEKNALRRYLEHLKREHPHLKLIILLDGLYADNPTLALSRQYGWHYIIIIVAKLLLRMAIMNPCLWLTKYLKCPIPNFKRQYKPAFLDTNYLNISIYRRIFPWIVGKGNVMNLSVTTSNVFKSVADCMEFLENNQSTKFFSHARVVTSTPETGNYLLLPEINRKIASYLDFADFVNFSAINVDNYIHLRGNKAVENQVLKNEAKLKEKLVFEDLKQRAAETEGGSVVTIESQPGWYHTTAPSQAFRAGHAQLTCNTEAGDVKIFREGYFGIFFRSLCVFATNDSVDSSFRSYCSLRAIAINNILDKKSEMKAVFYANAFLKVAKEVNNRDVIENKEDKLESLYKMIVGQDCKLSSDLPDWRKYLARIQNDKSSAMLNDCTPSDV